MAAALPVDSVTLELIASAADQGAVSKAALRANLSLAAASRRISEFEERIGIRIFERRARGVGVTPAGRALLSRIRLILSGVQNLVDAVEDVKSGVVDHLFLVANNSAIMQFLPELLGKFMAENPRIRVDVEEMVSSDIVRALEERRSNLGILWADTDVRGLEAVALGDEELVVVVPHGHALSARKTVRFAAALDYEFVGLRSESPLYACLRREAAKLNKVLHTRMKVRGFDAMCRMVEAGMGIGIVGNRAAAGFTKAMAITALTLREPWAHRRFCLLYRSAHELAPVERRFLAFMQAAHPKAG